MGIFDRAATALRAPLARMLAVEQLASPWADSSHLETITLQDLYGYAEGVQVNRSRAMQIGTVAAGRNTVAGTVGRLSLFAQKNNQRLPIQPTLLGRGQLERGVPRATTLTWTVDSLLFYPCTWWVVRERDSYNWPSWVEWVPQGKASTDADGNLTHVDGVAVRPEDVIRFDSPTGSGLLVDGARTIKRAIAIEDAAALAEDNPVPTMHLHNEGDKMTKEEIEELLTMWSAARRKRGVAYTSKGIKAEAMGTHVEQLLIEGRKAINLDLIRHMNTPAWAAAASADGTSLKYENRTSRNWELIDITCAPYMQAIVGRLSMPDVSPLGTEYKFDTDELTKPDQKTRFETYQLGKAAGFIDNEMISAWEGWDRIIPDKETTP